MIIKAESKSEALEKCKELADLESKTLGEKLNEDVLYYTFFLGMVGDDYDFAIAYMKAPNRGAKLSAMDLIYGMQATRAAENIWYAGRLMESTDERVEKDDDIYMGLMSSIIEQIKFLSVALKKK